MIEMVEMVDDRGSCGQSPAMSNGTVSRDLLLDVAAIFKLTTGRRFSRVDSGLEHSLGGWKGNQLHHYLWKLSCSDAPNKHYQGVGLIEVFFN